MSNVLFKAAVLACPLILLVLTMAGVIGTEGLVSFAAGWCLAIWAATLDMKRRGRRETTPI